MSDLHTLVVRACEEHAQAEEQLLKHMLGQWVSELEPSILRHIRTGKIIGLTIADIPIGTVAPVVVRAP